MKNLLTKPQLAEYLSISERTIDRYRARGYDMGVVRIGSTIRFDAEKVQQSIDKGAFGKRQNKRRK